MNNSDKIILDLCGGTGAWSKPYKDNGYDVRLVTLPEYDVRNYRTMERIYGILAAPVCTDFASSGARWWLQKDGNVALIEIADLDIVLGCLRIIQEHKDELVFWALENPVGRLRRYLGKPRLYFDPCDYGDTYTKKTCLWGKFNKPEKHPVEPVGKNPIWYEPPGELRQMKRSITPPGFAKAFYEANK